jgi:hypothetical protein
MRSVAVGYAWHGCRTAAALSCYTFADSLVLAIPPIGGDLGWLKTGASGGWPFPHERANPNADELQPGLSTTMFN